MTPAEAIPDLPSAVAYLFTAYRTRLDRATGLVYEHQLADIPLPIVRETVIAAPKRLPKPFVPGINEIRTLCESIRREMAAGQPYVPCDRCELQPGWVTVVDPGGAKRLTRCECWTDHQQRLTQYGLAGRPIALLDTGDDRDYRERQAND